MVGLTFKSELADYRKALVEQRPDDAQRRLAIKVIDRWSKHASVESIWSTLVQEIEAIDMPAPGQFIDLMLQRTILAARVEQVDQETPALEKMVQSRAKRHLKDRAYAKLAIEAGLHAGFIDQRKHVLGREKGGHRKIFIRGWREKFEDLCGQPLDEVVRVLTEIAFGTKETIDAMRGTRRATKRGDRDTRRQK